MSSELKLPDKSPKTPFERWLETSGKAQWPNYSRQDLEAAYRQGIIVGRRAPSKGEEKNA